MSPLSEMPSVMQHILLVPCRTKTSFFSSTKIHDQKFTSLQYTSKLGAIH
uniref:Uncharacterized protein n=1 Tax=Arundo donax TaxID=35708 RepID=A0A0A8XMX8_ARUDO